MLQHNPAYSFYRNSLKFPERLAVSAEGRRLTYLEFAGFVRRIAAWLRDPAKNKIAQSAFSARAVWKPAEEFWPPTGSAPPLFPSATNYQSNV